MVRIGFGEVSATAAIFAFVVYLYYLWCFPDRRMKWPQFTISDLLWSTTMIAAALAAIDLILRSELWQSWLDNYSLFAFVAFYLIWFGIGALFGAGVLKPFKKGALGACLGAVGQLGFLIYLFTG